MRDAFDESFDELIEKGYIEQAGIGPDGEPIYQLTDKALGPRPSSITSYSQRPTPS